MFFCKHCGQQNKEEARFCKECGRPIGGGSRREQQETASAAETAPQPRKPIPKKTILIWSSIAAALIILFAAYKTGAYLTSKKRLVDQFEQAVHDGDAKKLSALLTPSDSKLTLNENNVKPLLTYVKKHDELISSLRGASSEKDAVYAEKDGKTLLFFDHYELKIDPVYFRVTSNYKGADLYINKEKTGSVKKAGETQIFGPYTPGDYTAEAKLKNDVVDVVKKEEIQAAGSRNFDLDLPLDAEDVTFTLADRFKNAKGDLLINGKSIHKDPFKSVTYGPLLTDGSMTAAVEADFPWGKTKTADVPINSTDMELTLIPDQDTQKTIMETIVKTTKQYTKAMADGNTDQMTEAGSEWKEQTKEVVSGMKSSGTFLKDQYKETDFDLDSFTISQENGNWQVTVTGKELHQSAYFDENTKPDMEEAEPSFHYLLSYDTKDKKWVFEKADPAPDSAGTNMKKIKNDHPETYTSAWASSKGNTASGSVTSDQVTLFMGSYLESQSQAVNLNQFSRMADSLEKGSALYSDQQKLVTKLSSEGTTEEFNNFEVKSFSQDGSHITIKTYEEFYITKAGGSPKLRTYNWTYSGVVKNGRIYLTSIQ
ncbi:zinc ribbon domain-containing protein [Bacillus nakamurai]|uniref:zinc ribbon domain-containing protein n=1 Tax=Bacillus nakamurai TaxID=1793963 RepID=UPI001E5DCC0B|nr:zinc-ribbon domain-containing protein [Bacillus nakamurai]MCC9023616.1 zinc-ribbon domain-containing protein [Bacillus nakamurai]